MYRSFEEIVEEVRKKNPAGLSDDWIRAARFGWDACLSEHESGFFKADEEGLNPSGPKYL